MRSIAVTFGGLVTTVAALVALPVSTDTRPPSTDPGEAIFRGKGSCFVCHGPDGKGTALAPDLTDDAWVNFQTRPTRAQVEALVRAGVPKPVRHPAPMPPMGGARLSEEEVRQVAEHVLSLSASPAPDPAGEAPEPPAKAADRPRPPARETAAARAGTPGALPSLFSIMLGLQGDMARIGRGLWLESYDTIAAGARAVADHPTLKPEEVQRVAAVLGDDMSRFKAFDTRVHDLAVALAEAASAGDLEAVLAAEARLRGACVACHSAFRERLREGIGGS